jgi:hypothetical protein
MRSHTQAHLRVLVVEVGNRSVYLLGTTTNPDGRWTTQQIRNLVMDLDDRLTQFRFLVRDRVGYFAPSFDAVLADVDIRVVRIPSRCSRANRFAERFIRTVRAELTNRMLIFSQQHSRVVLPSVFGITTVDAHTVPTTFARPTPAIPWQTSAMNDQASSRSRWFDQRLQVDAQTAPKASLWSSRGGSRPTTPGAVGIMPDW